MNWGSPSDNQGMDSTIKSSRVAEVARKYQRALSIHTEKMLTTALNANRAVSSRMKTDITPEARARDEWQEEVQAIPLLYPGITFRKESRDIWGTAVFEIE